MATRTTLDFSYIAGDITKPVAKSNRGNILATSIEDAAYFAAQRVWGRRRGLTVNRRTGSMGGAGMFGVACITPRTKYATSKIEKLGSIHLERKKDND